MKITKNLRYTAALALITVCEAAFAKYIAVGGAVPMLGFCFCITTAFFEDDAPTTVIFSALFGCALDLLTSHGFGTYTLMFALCSAAAFSVRGRLLSSRILMLALFAFLLTLPVCAVYYVLHITEIGVDFVGYFLTKIIPCGIYNTAVSLAFYPICKRFFGKRR